MVAALLALLGGCTLHLHYHAHRLQTGGAEREPDVLTDGQSAALDELWRSADEE